MWCLPLCSSTIAAQGVLCTPLHACPLVDLPECGCSTHCCLHITDPSISCCYRNVNVVGSKVSIAAGSSLDVVGGSTFSASPSPLVKLSADLTGITATSGVAFGVPMGLSIPSSGTNSILNVHSLTAITKADIGLAEKAKAETTVLRVFGNGFFGKEPVGKSIDQRTVIYPGKASMSWQEPAGGTKVMKAWLGAAFDDSKSIDNQLSVPGMSALGTYTRDRPDSQTPVLKVYGNGWFGKDPATGTGVINPIEQRTVIYPGKVSVSWPGPGTPPSGASLTKAWLGRAYDDAHTKDQLSVDNNVTLVARRGATKAYTFRINGFALPV